MSASGLRRFHGVLTVLWALLIPVAFATGWIFSLAFISAISLYANVAGHFSSWQAARAEEAAED